MPQSLGPPEEQMSLKSGPLASNYGPLTENPEEKPAAQKRMQMMGVVDHTAGSKKGPWGMNFARAPDRGPRPRSRAARPKDAGHGGTARVAARRRVVARTETEITQYRLWDFVFSGF